MEEHQEELATIEAIDSGAVYTLALKTHVGMSIQTFRYFAGWCDKIQVRRPLLKPGGPSQSLNVDKTLMNSPTKWVTFNIANQQQNMDKYMWIKDVLFSQGSTIPINQARPNRNLTFTKKEPIGWEMDEWIF